MNAIEVYFYLFYKFYKLFERFKQTRWSIKAKAAICIGTLELAIYFSLVNYRDVLLNQNSNIDYYSFLIILAIISSKWFAFFKDDKWKDYTESFEKWPTYKNSKGSWIVFFVIIIIFANFIFSCILFSPLRELHG